MSLNHIDWMVIIITAINFITIVISFDSIAVESFGSIAVESFDFVAVGSFDFVAVGNFDFAMNFNLYSKYYCFDLLIDFVLLFHFISCCCCCL